jgi:hypothetical protein
MRKFVTGAQLSCVGPRSRWDEPPREVVWEKGKARLYRHGTGVEKCFRSPYCWSTP